VTFCIEGRQLQLQLQRRRWSWGQRGGGWTLERAAAVRVRMYDLKGKSG
jgi:hypothetical protein